MGPNADAPESAESARLFVLPVLTVREGKVDRKQQHIAFCAGQKNGEENSGHEVALLAPADSAHPEVGQFVLEWVIGDDHPKAAEWKKDVRRDVDFFLVEKQEEFPWGYLLYHCGTTSNAYAYLGGRVHFCHMPKTAP